MPMGVWRTVLHCHIAILPYCNMTVGNFAMLYCTAISYCTNMAVGGLGVHVEEQLQLSSMCPALKERCALQCQERRGDEKINSAPSFARCIS